MLEKILRLSVGEEDIVVLLPLKPQKIAEKSSPIFKRYPTILDSQITILKKKGCSE